MLAQPLGKDMNSKQEDKAGLYNLYKMPSVYRYLQLNISILCILTDYVQVRSKSTHWLTKYQS